MNAITISNGYDAGRRSYLNRVDTEAATQGKAGESWGRLLLSTVEASANGFITEADTDMIVARFVKRKSAELTAGERGGELSADTVDARKSDLAAGIKMGALTLDSVGVMSRAADLYRKNPTKAEFRAMFAAYLRVCRAQCKKEHRDYPLTDEQIIDLMTVSPAKPTTVEKKLKDAVKAMEAALKLNEELDTPMDLSKIVEAEGMVRRTLDLLDALHAQAQAQAALAAAKERARLAA